MKQRESRLPWYVVNTKPRKEEFVRIMLEQAGLEVFVPRVLEWSRTRRRVGEKVRLMFPGYLFVQMSVARHYARVRWMPGVRKVVGSQDRPSAVDSALVEELASRMGTRGYIVQRASLEPGDNVAVRRGPFTGLLGVVEGPSSAPERVRVLMTFFERVTPVEFHGRDLVGIKPFLGGSILIRVGHGQRRG